MIRSVNIVSYFLIRNRIKVAFTTEKGNEIWTPSLALAWKKFQQSADDFELEMPQLFINTLKNTEVSLEDVDESIYFGGGLSAEASVKINEELKQKYKSQHFQKVSSIRHDQAVFYGAMHKLIQLRHPFYNQPKKIMHFCREKVPCFEPIGQNQRSQILIVKYTTQDEFMIKIELKGEGDEMLIYRTLQKLTFNEVIQIATNIPQNGKMDPIMEKDIVKIPVFRIKAARVITQASLSKISFAKKQRKYSIAKLMESIDIKFETQPYRDRMDELTLSAPDLEKITLRERNMTIRGPFWIVLKHKEKSPYLVAHINKVSDVMSEK